MTGSVAAGFVTEKQKNSIRGSGEKEQEKRKGNMKKGLAGKQGEADFTLMLHAAPHYSGLQLRVGVAPYLT